MEAKIFKPCQKLKTKLFIALILIALAILIGFALMFGLIALDRSSRGPGLLIAFLVCAGLDALWYIPGMVLVVPYCNSLKYELHEDEVLVNAGIITRSVKHVPFRAITNISIRAVCSTASWDWGRCISRLPGRATPLAGRKPVWMGWRTCRKWINRWPENCGASAAGWRWQALRRSGKPWPVSRVRWRPSWKR